MFALFHGKRFFSGLNLVMLTDDGDLTEDLAQSALLDGEVGESVEVQKPEDLKGGFRGVPADKGTVVVAFYDGPVSETQFFGPFDDFSVAIEFARRNTHHDSWKIIPLMAKGE